MKQTETESEKMSVKNVQRVEIALSVNHQMYFWD